MRFKPYVKKPLVHSPKGETVLNNIKSYLIRTTAGEALTPDPGQALAALLAAKKAGLRCLVYAMAPVLGEDALELVDEDFLRSKL